MRWLSIALTAAAGALATSEAVAADDDEREALRFYAGLGAASLDYAVQHEGVHFSDTSVGLDLFGGFRLKDGLGIELAYKRFDDIAAHDIRGSGLTRLDIEVPLDIATVKAIGLLSLRELFGWQRNWRVFGSAGMYQTDFERTVVTLGSGTTESVRDEQSGITFGAGVLYEIGPVDIRGYIDWFGVLEDNEARTAGVAVQLSF